MPAWCKSMERGILSQMSSASSESGWKFGGPSQNIPQVALKRAVNITKINLLYLYTSPNLSSTAGTALGALFRDLTKVSARTLLVLIYCFTSTFQDVFQLLEQRKVHRINHIKLRNASQ
ncbi:hypothetical protein AVEN_244625-1 [Araneus ventricosus]|uniref:Uncharacterized protein n=1 Tax=Araneus ventricosus TaxID=182803 RepID=A0A4Y2MH06_ARAVE|nr:hypothetical protein AVEN_244625-1 [Araneus ventricosus]